jgi:hypothetical protein
MDELGVWVLIIVRLPLEQVSRRALEKTLLWALHDDGGKETIPFEAMSDVRVLEAF